jgi:hypothetical protein
MADLARIASCAGEQASARDDARAEARAAGEENLIRDSLRLRVPKPVCFLGSQHGTDSILDDLINYTTSHKLSDILLMI